MRKILILCTALTMFAIESKAQLPPTLMLSSSAYGNGTDTAAAPATTKWVYYNVRGPQKTVGIVLTMTKISGTAAGAVNWQGSQDGVNYATISSTTIVDWTGTVSYQYNETDKHFYWYRAQLATTGASSISFFGWIYATKMAQ